MVWRQENLYQVELCDQRAHAQTILPEFHKGEVFVPLYQLRPKEFAGLAHQSSPTTEDKDIDAAVSSIISAKFAEKMAVERVTHHLLQGKKFLQIQVSMPPDILIR
ncbi:PREDICTED: metal tolerance protein C1-like [Fragaria vesca subsp. vesca]